MRWQSHEANERSVKVFMATPGSQICVLNFFDFLFRPGDRIVRTNFTAFKKRRDDRFDPLPGAFAALAGSIAYQSIVGLDANKHRIALQNGPLAAVICKMDWFGKWIGK